MEPSCAGHSLFVKHEIPALLVLLCAGCVQARIVAPVESTEDPPVEPHETRIVQVPGDEPGEELGAEPTQAAVSVSVSTAVPGFADPVFFRIGAGYGALGQVDLHSCREQGLPAGYVHMRVTFRDTGQVVRASVESPTAPPPDALVCIGEQLRLAMVPRFEGGEVTLSRSFFVN